MATFVKRGKSWAVRVRMKGVHRTASFASKADAVSWAQKTEAEIAAGARGAIPKKTVGDLIRRFMEEVLPGHDGERQERLRLQKLFGKPDADPPSPIHWSPFDFRLLTHLMLLHGGIAASSA